MKLKILAALSIALALVVTACGWATPTPIPPPTPTLRPPSLLSYGKPTRVAEFDGYVVTLNDCYWEGDELTTAWQFFNDRAQKNRSISIYAYDQGGNRVWCQKGTWPMGCTAPMLWPGETETNTMAWKAGPRSSEVIITVTEAAKWAYEKEGEIPIAQTSFSITRTCIVSPPVPR